MFLNLLLKSFLFIFMITSNLYTKSIVDELIEKKDFQTLQKTIDNTKVLQNENQIPLDSKENDLIVIEDDYGIKILYEFYDGQWQDKSNPTIAKILKNDKGTTFKNLFNYKVDATEFNPYESDTFKYEEEKKTTIAVKFINSLNKEDNINKNIANFLEEKQIASLQVINIQLLNTDRSDCTIVVIYRY